MTRFFIFWAGNENEWMDGHMTHIEAESAEEAMIEYTERLDGGLRDAIRADFKYDPNYFGGEVAIGRSGDAFIEVFESD